MGELTREIRKFSFKGILVILLVFIVIAVILFIELTGINAIRYDRQLELLPDELALKNAEVCATLPKDALLLIDSSDAASILAYEQFGTILNDMKIGHEECDVAKEAIPSFDTFSQVIVLLANLTPMGEKVVTLCEWVHDGGEAWFPLTLETNAYSSAISQMIGIDALSPSYYVVEAIYVNEGFMIGGGRAFALSDPFESSRTVILDEKSTTVYASANELGGVPLVWTAKYGNGMFVVDNIGIYDKYVRGFYAASYSLLSDVCVYPVVNSSTYYLDDFPSQIPSGNSEYIQRDYNTTIRDFYINIWWPDMINFADKYGIKYTGLAILSYDDHIDGTADATPDTGTFLNFGNMLLRKGGELGYHGYNHQPLYIEMDYKGHYDYKTWQSEAAIKKAFDELVSMCATLFPDTEFALYVPPSNLLSDEGRNVLITEYPNIKTISGIYFADAADAELDLDCMQEFEVHENGVVDQPRVVSGFILDDFQNLAAISELNMHFVNSHFTHPDDALDPERGAELGWEEMKRRFDGFLSWLYTSAPCLRNMTGTEASAAVQRYVACAPHTEVYADRVKITIDNFYDEVQLLVRFNEKLPGEISGGTLTHLTGGLYLVAATEDVVDITLK